VQSVPVSPAIATMAVSAGGDQVLVGLRSKSGSNVRLYDLTAGRNVWTATVRERAARLLSAPDGTSIVVTQRGRVGEGALELAYLSPDGQPRGRATAPDKLTDALICGDQVIVGCRDGYLYAFDFSGALRWRFQVPDQVLSTASEATWKACPYFLSVAPDGGRILFSTWESVFMLDDGGTVLWSWKTSTDPIFIMPPGRVSPLAASADYAVLGLTPPVTEAEARSAYRRMAFLTHPDQNPNDPDAGEKFKAMARSYEAVIREVAGEDRGGSGGMQPPSFDLEISFGSLFMLNTIYGVAVSADGRRSAVTTRSGVLVLLDARGQVEASFIASDGYGQIATTPDLARLVYTHHQGLSFFTPEGLENVFPTERGFRARYSPNGRYAAAWLDRSLLLFSGRGSLLQELELARPIGDLAFRGERELLVGAGGLHHFELPDVPPEGRTLASDRQRILPASR
jgi:hypothetical protein